MNFIKLKVLLPAILIVPLALTYQNCSRAKFERTSKKTQDVGLLPVDPNASPLNANPPTCSFNGQQLSEGGTVTAYQNSTVPAEQSCQQEVRTCQDGALTGVFAYASCSPNVPASCLFNGQTVASGQSVTAYANSVASSGSACSDKTQSETRTCTNGVLSGSFNFSTCSNAGNASCLFNGQTVGHGQTVVAYLTSTVSAGQSCQARSQTENRVCNNGVLSGSYNFSSCTVAAAASCLFNGQTVAHGQNVIAYANSTVTAGQSCATSQNSETRTCTNGVLSGSFNYSSCSPAAAASCLFNGQTIANGQSVMAYNSSTVTYGLSCDGADQSESRICSNGVLSGSFNYSSCSPAAAASCLFNGQTIAHGQGVTAYSVSSSTNCQGSSQTRNCNNGTLSGTYNYATCSANNASCLFNGQTIAHGQSVNAYASSTVPYGQSCNSVAQMESRTCANGTLSGSFTQGSCTTSPAASCAFNGQAVASGQSVQAYASLTVPFGSQCQVQTRSCTNGALSGSYTYAACTVGTAASCTFNGQTVAHGSTVWAYNTTTVPYGQNCSSYRTARSCSNGTMSGSSSYSYSSCSTAQAVSCIFNGQTIPHDAGVTAYASATVPSGSTCQSQTRVCSNGVLSGTNTFDSCVVDPIPPFCEESFTKDMCDIYQYLYGRWPDRDGANYWTTNLSERQIPKACWYREILFGTVTADCENYRQIWKSYPLTNGIGACSNMIPPAGSLPPHDAPLAASTAQCP